jgi:glucose/arabinose dehydrogenase
LILFLFTLAGCRFGIGTANRLPDGPAPTTIPLSSPVENSLNEETIALPPGFQIEIYADDLRGPRMLALGLDGQVYVTERGEGRVLRLSDDDGDGRVDRREVVVDALNSPSGLAFFQDGSLYIAEPDRVLRFTQPAPGGPYGGPEVIMDGIPTGGHNTRTLAFSPDWMTLYISIGSSCNVCEEEDPRRAAIIRIDPDGGGEALFAAGLRNAVGMVIRPGTEEIWATNNGRDWLGDDLPPETVYQVRPDEDYGWPRCHSGRIVDPDFGDGEACEGVALPAVEIQAHSAPLGLTFYTGSAFPEAYRGDLFVALHGSWNRREPTGYKVVRIPMDGDVPGTVEDFATGWLRPDGTNWGRPVDLLTAPDGSLLVSEDSAGTIYRIFYQE